MRKKAVALSLILAVSIILLPMSMPVLAQGGTWSPMASGTTAFLNGVWGSSSTDVFAVGIGGTIRHYDGSSWSPMTSGTTDQLWAVWGTSPSDVFAVGEVSYHDGFVLHYNGVDWSQMASPPGGFEGLFGVWGSSSTDVYAVGMARSVYHYDGANWSVVDTGTTGYDDFYAVWGTSPSDIFVAGHHWMYTTASVVHYDGASWSRWDGQSIGAATLKGVWGSSSTDVFAVGHGPTIVHYNGVDWSKMDPAGITNEHFWGIWGTSSSDVFAVGTRGKIIHYDGAGWSLMTSGTTSQLGGVWGTSHSDVFAVGQSGTILHYACPQVATATGTGIASLCTGSGTMVNLTAVAESSLPTVGKPNLQFPHGFFSFDITGLSMVTPETVTITIEFPYAVPAGSQYWKYHVPEGWINVTSLVGDNDGDNILTLTITDGGFGDDDGVFNGQISDDGGPGSPTGSGQAISGPVFPNIYIGIAAAFGAAVIAYMIRRRLIRQA